MTISIIYTLLIFQVKICDRFFHPNLDTYLFSVKVVYKMSTKRTKQDVKNLHESVRAQAAHNFNLTLRL